jgi:hypothetical protein
LNAAFALKDENKYSVLRSKHRFGCENQSVNSVWGNSRRVCTVIITEHTCTLWAKVEFLALKTWWYLEVATGI